LTKTSFYFLSFQYQNILQPHDKTTQQKINKTKKKSEKSALIDR